MAIITERRKLTSQEKRSESNFDEAVYLRHRQNVPEYEPRPAHKSYFDLDVRQMSDAEENRAGRIFMSRGGAAREKYDYEVVLPAAEPIAQPQTQPQTQARERLYDTAAAAPTAAPTAPTAPAREQTQPREFESEDTGGLTYRPELMPSEETMKSLLRADTMAPSRAGRTAREVEVFLHDEEADADGRQAHITLNTRGKITVAAYIALILAMMITALVTASSIAALSAQAAALREDLLEKQGQIQTLSALNEALSDEEIMRLKAGDLGFSAPVEGVNLLTAPLPATAPELPYVRQTNWFDALCNFIAGLFGR